MREDAGVKPAFGLQDEALEQQEQYSEKVDESQQQSEGAHQEEQQSQGDAAPSSQERLGFIGAGQVRLLLRYKGSQHFACIRARLCAAPGLIRSVHHLVHAWPSKEGALESQH